MYSVRLAIISAEVFVAGSRAVFSSSFRTLLSNKKALIRVPAPPLPDAAGHVQLMSDNPEQMPASESCLPNILLIEDDLAWGRLLTAGQIHVKQDTSPTISSKMQEQINDAMKGELPAAWGDALKEYYRKLSAE